MLGTPPAVLDEWAAEADRQRGKAMAEAAKARRQDWKAWVHEAARNRPGLLYRWVRGDPPLPVQGLQT